MRESNKTGLRKNASVNAAIHPIFKQFQKQKITIKYVFKKVS